MSEKGWMQIFINPLFIIIIIILLIELEWIIAKRTKWMVNMKRISVLIYASTFLGIFSMVYDNKNYVLDIDYHIIKERIAIDYQRDFLNKLDWLESYHSVPFGSSDFSPSNFVDLQHERSDFHDWILNIMSILEKALLIIWNTSK